MNDIDNMPSKCQSCPYWEACEYPHICDDMKPKANENGNINAESAENPQDRPIDGDLISRQMAIDALDCINGVEEVLKSLPSVQPKRGKWIIMDAGFPVPKCSVCGEKANMRKRSYYNFCPNCGADMRGE